MRFEFVYMIIFTFLSWASDPLVRLMESPALRAGEPIYLQDLANIEGGDDVTQEQLKKILIASSMEELKESGPLLLHIRSLLNDFKKTCQCQVQMHVPRNYSLAKNKTKVNEKQEFSEEQLKLSLMEKIKSDCKSCRIEISSLRCTRGEPLPSRLWEMHSQIAKTGGETPVQIYFSDRTKPVEYLAHIKLEVPAWRLKNNAPLGTSLDDGLLEMVWVPPSPVRTAATLEDIKSSEIKRSIPAQQIIYIDDLREKHVVRAGRPVRVEIIKGSMVLETTGVPHKDAKVGEYISVRLAKSNKSVVAEVMSPGKVRVQ